MCFINSFYVQPIAKYEMYYIVVFLFQGHTGTLTPELAHQVIIKFYELQLKLMFTKLSNTFKAKNLFYII